MNASTGTPAPVIRTLGLGKVYSPGSEAEVVALRNVDLSVAVGEFIAIMGPSGSGKSTLMNLIGCLDTPSSGRYLCDGVDVATLERSEMMTRLSEPQLYEDIDLDAETIPARIGGEVFGDVDGTEVLAVSVNGVIGAVTRSYLFDDEARYLAMVHPDMFVAGANEIDLLEVTAGGELLLVTGVGS